MESFRIQVTRFGIKNVFCNLCDSNLISKFMCMCVHVQVCARDRSVWLKPCLLEPRLC